MSELTPLMKQYFNIKEMHEDAILMFRLGDFYEMFGEDARIASKILQIALTTRDRTREDPIPMCGVPYFAADSYISKLVKAGYKVAICEQMEDAKEAKGIVQREVVKVFTPGTYIPENPKENCYILSFFPEGQIYGVALADISTGDFFIYETEKSLSDEISRFEPKEILYPLSLKDNIHYAEMVKGLYSTPVEDWLFDFGEAYRSLLEHFRVSSLDGFGCEGFRPAISAAGALLNYLIDTQRGSVRFRKLSPLRQESFMFLDSVTQRNLELTKNLKGGSEGTLLSVLDETQTPMGGRFLRNALLRPLIEREGIIRRLDAIEWLTNDYELIEVLRGNLRKIQDLERLASRITAKTANPRDLIAIKNSVTPLTEIKRALLKIHEPYLRDLGLRIADLSGVKRLIEDAIVENPPITVREGGIIKDGYNYEIDELRKISTQGKDFIAELERKEKEKTGINSLKVGYNKIFGYYIEVTKPNLDLVPDYYIRKQTLVNGERFITPELKEYEVKVTSATENLKNLEYQLFQEVIDRLSEISEDIVETGSAVGEIDFLTSLSIIAKRYNYTRPEIDDSVLISITDGRHPVIERNMSEPFIPNDISINGEQDCLLILTGPNMAGKSTFMRQVALIVLMAQMGSFVPATEAKIGIVDRIFTRIGAADYIFQGQSTFMVEMIETANILNNATNRSLILLDEIGRGTSTFDGISIAWAVAEYILKEIKARTLFATHYNELTELNRSLDGIRNYNASVKEWGEEIIFLRKIVPGAADRSYGIHVARLAGLPETVINRAREVLTDLEKKDLSRSSLFPVGSIKSRQMDLFSIAHDPIRAELINLDFSKLTPKMALAKLKELEEKAKAEI
ncbi:MAG: DNA mismatch repair protein MutS [Thermodesulfovibrionales bacterium]